jgi:hypothetical protein
MDADQSIVARRAVAEFAYQEAERVAKGKPSGEPSLLSRAINKLRKDFPLVFDLSKRGYELARNVFRKQQRYARNIYRDYQRAESDSSYQQKTLPDPDQKSVKNQEYIIRVELKNRRSDKVFWSTVKVTAPVGTPVNELYKIAAESVKAGEVVSERFARRFRGGAMGRDWTGTGSGAYIG